MIQRAIAQLDRYLAEKTQEIKELESTLRWMAELNHRQRALMSHALRNPDAEYTIESHRMSHDVVYETARTDLRDLEHRGLLTARKRGKMLTFRPAKELERRLRAHD